MMTEEEILVCPKEKATRTINEIRIYPIGAAANCYYRTDRPLCSPDGKEITPEQLLSPDYGWEFICIEAKGTKQYIRVAAIESVVINPKY